MRVYVNFVVRNHKVDGSHGIALRLQQPGVCLFDGEGQHPALYQAAVDEEGHIGAVGAANTGRGGKTLDGVTRIRVFGVDFQHILRNLRTVDRQHCLPRLTVPRSSQRGSPIVQQPEADFREGQGIATDQFLNPCRLRLGRTKELATGRLVAE